MTATNGSSDGRLKKILMFIGAIALIAIASKFLQKVAFNHAIEQAREEATVKATQDAANARR
jgi:hypothetical protein